MSVFSTFDRHATLVSRMADTLGHDLEADMMSGDLRPEDFRSMVLKCTGCTQPGACSEWLDKQMGHADSTPDYCRNKAVLESPGR